MIYALILARVALTAVAGVNNATLANIAAVRLCKQPAHCYVYVWEF